MCPSSVQRVCILYLQDCGVCSSVSRWCELSWLHFTGGVATTTTIPSRLLLSGDGHTTSSRLALNPRVLILRDIGHVGFVHLPLVQLSEQHNMLLDTQAYIEDAV